MKISYDKNIAKYYISNIAKLVKTFAGCMDCEIPTGTLEGEICRKKGFTLDIR